MARGESDVIKFTDADVRGGLIAMIQVRDPVELGGQIDENSHGTGFDRVGAFSGRLHRRRRTVQDVLHRRPREPADQHPVRTADDPNQGNLPIVDPNPDPTDGPADVVTLLPASLTRFWTEQLAASNLTLAAPTVTLFTAGTDTPTCEGIDSTAFESNIFYCAPSNTIYVDQQYAEDSDRQPAARRHVGGLPDLAMGSARTCRGCSEAR